jgi:hypothetical protein
MHKPFGDTLHIQTIKIPMNKNKKNVCLSLNINQCLDFAEGESHPKPQLHRTSAGKWGKRIKVLCFLNMILPRSVLLL